MFDAILLLRDNHHTLLTMTVPLNGLVPSPIDRSLPVDGGDVFILLLLAKGFA